MSHRRHRTHSYTHTQTHTHTDKLITLSFCEWYLGDRRLTTDTTQHTLKHTLLSPNGASAHAPWSRTRRTMDESWSMFTLIDSHTDSHHLVSYQHHASARTFTCSHITSIGAFFLLSDWTLSSKTHWFSLFSDFVIVSLSLFNCSLLKLYHCVISFVIFFDTLYTFNNHISLNNPSNLKFQFT